MKKLVYVFSVIIAAGLFAVGCRQTPPADAVQADSDTVMIDETVEVDSTVYGVCGEGTAMHTLELVTDGGDTLYYTYQVEEDASVLGGLMVGDRIAVMGTEMLGKWTSLDKNFEIVEGGMVSSNVEAESNPWVSWKILNGHLLLNTDTFDIVELGADSLYIENKSGIYVYKRAL